MKVMVLQERLVNLIYYYFQDCGLKDNLTKTGNSMNIIDFNFTFDVKGKSLEVLISPLEEIDYDKFQKYFEGLPNKNLRKGYPKVAEQIKKYKKYLKGKKFTYENNQYFFRAEFTSHNENKALQSIVNCVIREIMLYSEKQKK